MLPKYLTPQRNGVRPSQSLGAACPWRWRFQMLYGRVRALASCEISWNECLRLSDYESRRRFDSTVGKRRHETRDSGIDFLERVSAPLRRPELLFPSKYADYFGASHVFVLHRTRDTLSRQDGRRKFIISPRLATCYLCPAVWFLDFLKPPRPIPAIRRALKREKNLCATNDDSQCNLYSRGTILA